MRDNQPRLRVGRDFELKNNNIKSKNVERRSGAKGEPEMDLDCKTYLQSNGPFLYPLKILLTLSLQTLSEPTIRGRTFDAEKGTHVTIDRTPINFP